MVSPRSPCNAGPGRQIFVSWGPAFEGEAEILAWEPTKKFAWKDPMGLVEWTLESRGGKSIVQRFEVKTKYVGFLPRLFEPFITPEANKKLSEDLHRRKHLVEEQPRTS